MHQHTRCRHANACLLLSPSLIPRAAIYRYHVFSRLLYSPSCWLCRFSTRSRSTRTTNTSRSFSSLHRPTLSSRTGWDGSTIRIHEYRFEAALCICVTLAIDLEDSQTVIMISRRNSCFYTVQQIQVQVQYNTYIVFHARKTGKKTTLRIVIIDQP